MASYDPRSDATPQTGSHLDRALPVRLDWSALFGGTLVGWGLMLLLSLIGATIGLSVIDPFTSRPASSNAGAAIWGAASAVISSFVGGFAVVRLAGERRRAESFAHGLVSWGKSMLLAGFIGLFAAGFAAFTRTPVANTTVAKGTRGQTGALVATTGDGPLVAGFATAGALLSLVASLLGARLAATRTSGVPLSEEPRPRAGDGNGPSAPLTGHTDVRRDQTTILPPTH